MLARTWNNKDFHSLLVRMKSGTAILEDTLAVSYKTKYTLTIWSSNCSAWYLLKELKTSVHTKPCAWMFIAPLFTNKGETWKQPSCPSIGKWINKLVHPDHGLLLNIKKKWRTHMHITKWKKPVWKGYIQLHMLYGDTKKIFIVGGRRRRGWINRQSAENF